MVGKIRTLEHCPKCVGKFEGEPLRCPKCLVEPRRYFIDLHLSALPGGRAKIYSDPDGYALDSYERAERILTTIRYEIDRGKFDPRDYVRKEIKGLEFEIYVRRWLERRRQDRDIGVLSHEYLRKLEGYCNKYLIPYFARRPLRDIYEGHIDDFKRSLPGSLSLKTIAHILATLRSIFTEAWKRRDVSRLPVFPKIETGEPPVRWLTLEEQKKVLEQITDPARRAFFLFLMRQGCRPGEARALRWDKVDMRSGVVEISAAMDREVFKPYTKEKNVRLLPLHPDVIAALDHLPRSITGFVWTLDGKPYRARLVIETWIAAARKAKVKATCYQGTRHSLASQAINAGVPENLVRDMLGHRTNSMTKRYAHLRTEALKQVWETVRDDRPQTVRSKKNGKITN